MANQLVKKVGIYFIGNMSTKITMALMIPIYAFFVLPDALGMFDFIQALTIMISPLAYAAVWESLLRFIMIEKDGKQVERTISTVLLFFFFMSMLVIGLTGVLVVQMDSWCLEILCCSAMVIFYSAAQTWQFFSRSLGNSKLYTTSGIISALVNFAFIILLVCILNMQFMGLVWSYLIGQVCIFVIIESRIRLIAKMRISDLDLILLKKILIFSLPLAANLIFLTAINSFGRIVVTTHFGAEINGFYTFALRFGSIISALGNIFAMAVIEESILRIGSADSTSFLSKVADISIKALFQLSSLALPFVALFFFVIRDTGYFEAWAYSPLTMLYGALVVLSTVIGNVFQIEKKTERAMLSTLFGAIVVVVGSLLAAFFQSFYGILIALLLGAFVMLATRVVLGRKLIRYDFPFARAWAYMLVYGGQVVLYIMAFRLESVLLLVVWAVLALVIFCPMIIKQYKALSTIADA